MKRRVLLLDSSLTLRMALSEMLVEAGFEVRAHASLHEARAEVLDGELIGALVVEANLDGAGLELAQQLRALCVNVPPIVLLAERSSHRFAPEVAAWLDRPPELRDLVAALERVMRSTLRPSVGPGQHQLVAESRPIVIVDDSPTFRNALARELEYQGHRVLTAASGEEGLRLIERAEPLAAVIDGILPGIDGASLIRRMRLDAALRGVPCVLMTASSDIDDELRALESGADAFVRKDEEMGLLLAKVAALLRTAGEASVPELAPSSLTTKRILAVDDSLTYRAELGEALRAEGYSVLEADSGERALELLAIATVDCILLDLVMPGIGGHETCRRLKLAPVTRDIPIVVLTGIEDRSAMLEGLALGADDFIQKSQDFSVLKARVRAQLRRRQFEDETRRVRERLLRSEIEAADARTAREVVEARASMVAELEQKNRELHGLATEFQRANGALGVAYRDLQAAQAQLVQSAKMASLGALVAGIAHEINNPLAFVLNHLHTVRRCLARVGTALPLAADPNVGPTWTRAVERADQMDAGLQRIRELIVKLRTFSRIDEGERKRVSLRECIDSVLLILEHRFGSRIQVETSLNAPDEFECYPGLLNQALMNLISNAIDAIEGQGTIRVGTELVDEDHGGGKLELTITDDGMGIPDAIRERLIEPFFTTKPVGQGTGLGLSITYSIVQKHGGTLRFEPAQGRGTRVVMRLPHDAPGP